MARAASRLTSTLRPSTSAPSARARAHATRRDLDATRRYNGAKSAAAARDLCQAFDKGRAGSGERVLRRSPARKWRGRADGVSVKSGQEHVCKDAGVQAAEVQRALGSACPHSRAAAAVGHFGANVMDAPE